MIIQGDCLEVMKTLPENSVDAIVTDPPYNLASIVKRFGKEGSAPAQFGKDGSFNRLSKGFMGKEWDNEIAFGVEIWKEALRVLKPGGFLLSFGGTRTYHRMTCGIEDAGFEIRDCIMWLYGSGFPKSLNIGKAVDKLQGNDREVVGVDERFNEPSGIVNIGQGERKKILRKITKGNSDWEGWGTALKPACEPIVVARKPLSEKSVALNVLKWGTGGMNIDGCRIGVNGGTKHEDGEKEYDNEIYGKGLYKEFGKRIDGLGRFPANIILDEEAGKLMPDDENDYDDGSKQQTLSGNIIDKAENKSASRFFYCAKASKSERNLGCDELEDIKGGSYQFRQDGSLDGSIPIKKNNHPTVKPIKLIQYLVRLVTPKGGIVLDPFLGSGTTAIVCIKLNRKFIGIEKEEEYIKIAEARIKPFIEQKKL